MATEFKIEIKSVKPTTPTHYAIFVEVPWSSVDDCHNLRDDWTWTIAAEKIVAYGSALNKFTVKAFWGMIMSPVGFLEAAAGCYRFATTVEIGDNFEPVRVLRVLRDYLERDFGVDALDNEALLSRFIAPATTIDLKFPARPVNHMLSGEPMLRV